MRSALAEYEKTNSDDKFIIIAGPYNPEEFHMIECVVGHLKQGKINYLIKEDNAGKKWVWRDKNGFILQRELRNHGG